MKLAPALLLLVSVAQAAAGESQPVLLDFHAEWCGPCRQVRPAVQALVDKGYPIKSYDIDKSPKVAARYEVDAVPTFIVVDAQGRELDRTSGPQPAAQLARFYLAARDKDAGGQDPSRDDGDAPRAGPDDDEAEEAPVAEAAPQAAEDAAPEDLTEEEIAQKARRKPVNPKPWETVVRIKVYNGNSIGFGSGTVIYSTPEESLILTCAHIFKMDGDRQVPPAKFPNKIAIDLFDGRLKGQQLACIEEGIPGKAVDYDFGTDVGLIRFKPGRRLPYSRVVPPHWQPKARMGMYTVGCSEGHDATAWDTVITKPPSRMLRGNDRHVAIECTHAPKQGRSGGGLYTSDGYIAGVCNFAEPQGDRGLYAAPESIYKLLDGNSYALLYAPASPGGTGTLLADRGATRRPGTIARGQSPDPEQRPRVVQTDDVTIPEPGILGATLDPLSPAGSRKAQVQPASNRGPDRRVAWSSPSSSKPLPPEDLQPTDSDIDGAADNAHFPPPAFEEDEEDSRVNDEDVAPRKPIRKPAPAAAAPSGWRPAGSSSR